MIKMVVSWERFHADALVLTRKLRRDPSPWRSVVAITRGGLVPASVVAYGLGIRVVDTISVGSYEGTTRGELSVMKPATITSGGGVLIIDDLVDTGETATAVRSLLPGCTYAAVYGKPAGSLRADVVAQHVRQHVWIDFPWEIEL